MAELGSGNGTGYPSVLDTDNTQESSSTTARSDVPNDLGAAVVAIETELGTDPAGTLTNVKTFLQTEHNTNGTHSAITATTITATDLTLSGAAASPPDANTLVKDNIVKGWLRLDGSGAINIDGSYNVDSVDDNGVGDYTINWDTDFANVNYSFAGMSQADSIVMVAGAVPPTTAALRLTIISSAGIAQDVDPIGVIAIGDQA